MLKLVAFKSSTPPVMASEPVPRALAFATRTVPPLMTVPPA